MQQRISFKKNVSLAIFAAVFIVSLFFVTIPESHIAKGAACGDGTCNGAENMFNCKTDCLPPGVPTKSITVVLGDATKWLIGFASMAALAILVWGGVYYTSSSGDPQKADTAKKLVKYSILGLIVVGVSYAIIVALDQVF